MDQNDSDSGLHQETVLGIDNIALELPIAGLGSRVLSAAIDYTLLAILVILGFILTLSVMLVSGLSPGWTVAILIALYFVIEWGYFAGLEVALRGRTIGKLAVRLQVVSRDGGAPAVSALVVRNLLRVVDLVAGLPLLFIDPLARRLGDRMAGTLVVHHRRAEEEVSLGKIPPGWGAREVAVVESYLRRSRQMEPAQSRDLARRLLRLVERDAPDLLAEVPHREDAEQALRLALDVREG